MHCGRRRRATGQRFDEVEVVNPFLTDPDKLGLVQEPGRYLPYAALAAIGLRCMVYPS